MTRVLFFVVLVMALVALRANLRARRLYAVIGGDVPNSLNTGLLIVGAVALLAVSNLIGLTSSFGMVGLIVSGALACSALAYVATRRAS